MPSIKTISWDNNNCKIVDQTQLPMSLIYEDITTIEEMHYAIKILKVRGAPAIGIAAAYGLYLGMRKFPASGTKSDFMTLLQKNIDYLSFSRPTAVNLVWALKKLQRIIENNIENDSINSIKNSILENAHTILKEDIISCKAIGENGFELLKDCDTLLTHCNAGGLATGFYGTALAPIYIGQEKGKIFHVFADETRPLLQGSRITAMELKQSGIPVTLICDNMAAFTMAQGLIDAVIVGADRIAQNGDVANKIGTYSVALSAKAHNIPFYVAAPTSTFDISLLSGKEIPIEERDANEIINGFGKQTAPTGVSVYNPAFDITPNELITAIITEKGVLKPSFKESINALF